METKALNQWLSRLEELQPPDGRLTEDIIQSVGGLPLPDPPKATTDEEAERALSLIRMNKVAAKTHVLTFARSRVNEAGAKCWELQKSGGNDREMRKYEAEEGYWKSISEWVEQL